mmetsp:Transcript_22098/g.46465  ORF Transcript_22098/g.46465 Transcript_22098/m.46465 type:complete len:203 (-) Transcript_22098:40-648(-)
MFASNSKNRASSNHTTHKKLTIVVAELIQSFSKDKTNRFRYLALILNPPIDPSIIMGDSGRCMFNAACCCYNACDAKNIDCCCKDASDCLCIRSACCMSFTSKSRGCGCVTDKGRGECCKIACCCCDLGFIAPTKLCAGASQILCCYQVESCPCSPDYVGECVCAICFVQCCPRCGICAAPPSCPALDKIRADQLTPIVMER